MKFRVAVWCLVATMAFDGPALAAEGRTPIFQAGTVITAGGRYIVTQNLTGTGASPVIEIAGSGGIDIDLNGFELNNGAGPAAVILLTNGNNDTVHGGRLVGGGNGIDFPGGGNSTYIEDVKIRGTSGAGIHTLGGGNHTFRRVTITNPGTHGIFLDGADGVNIEDSFIANMPGDGIRLQGGSSHRVVRTTVFGTGYGVFVGSSSTWIENSRVTNCRLEAILVSGVIGGAIWNNLVGGLLHGIRVNSTSRDISLRENQVTGSGETAPLGTYHGIQIEGSLCSIERNHLTGNAGRGLFFTATSGSNTYGGNTAMGNQGGPCAGTAYGTDFCDDVVTATTNVSFGNNLIPTLH